MVVGGAGFLGSHLVDRLLADGTEVDVVDDLSTGSLGNLSEARAVGGTLKIHHLSADSSEAASLIGMRVPDVVYHLAAVPRGRPSPATMAGAFGVSLALLDAARVHRIPKIVVALPATSLYGRPASRDLPVKEHDLVPRGVRGVVARATIDLLAEYREHEAVEFTALAIANVYGSRQRPGDGVVATFLAAAAAGRSPTMTGDGRQTRDLLFVDDAIDALVRAGTRGSGLVINVGTGEQTSVRDLWVAVAGPQAPAPEHVEATLDEVYRFAVSPVRARIHLGWSSWTALADGLALCR
jgi:UDP-glucose 4-epimerase